MGLAGRSYNSVSTAVLHCDVKARLCLEFAENIIKESGTGPTLVELWGMGLGMVWGGVLTIAEIAKMLRK